ncbi:MAG: hypothetical protein ABIZ05_07445 [Pseudonocardiaceae bacterium]
MTLVGEKVFAAGIHASSDASTVDFRSDYASLAYSVIEPPEHVIAGMVAFMRKFGLSFGRAEVSRRGGGDATPTQTATMVRTTARQEISVGIPHSTAGPCRALATSLITRLVGVVGCLAVAAIHVIDQGGVPGTKGPEYVQIMYYALEAAGVVVAVLLLANQTRLGWWLSLGVAAGPIVGYALSRGPGLPDYTDDIGNWTEPLGVLSLIVEGILLILAAASVVTSRRTI